MQASLFKSKTQNLIPENGEVYYHGTLFNKAEAQASFLELNLKVAWEKERIQLFGKEILLPRRVAWYGEKEYKYRYSGVTKVAKIWNEEILKLKTLVESICRTHFNSCLLNYYPDGNSGMGWHSDDEESLTENSSIASLSFGAERKFSLKSKNGGSALSILLENGSLLEMKGSTQKHWLHCLPKSKKISEPRINLSFRLMKDQ